MRLEVLRNFATAYSDGRFCGKRLLLLAMLLQPFELEIHAMFDVYRCSRRKVRAWCRGGVREEMTAVREERRGG
jgi:hypothetical protein